MYIGASNNDQLRFPGYISNLRIVKGQAVYTAAFTPSTSPLTTTSQGVTASNVSLLTCQSNRFKDNSNNAFAVTATNTSVQRFNPFGTSTAYSTATIGGSGYFDGSGDTLTVPYSSTLDAGTGAYSFECWVYFSGSGSNQGVIGTTGDGFAGFERSSGIWAYYYGGSGVSTGTACVLNQWNHVVICRNSSSNGAFFVNGVRLATFTDSANKSGFGNLQIGYNGVAGGAYTTGYITDYRYVKGNPYDPTASTLTVPTSPVTAVSGTTTLLNCTNGAIYDNAMMNDLETVGNAQISTSVKKYGTGSMYFDGAGDYLSSAASPNLDMGTGDWTIECWVYVSSRSLSYPTIFGNNNGSYSAGALSIQNSNADSGTYNNKFCLAAYDVYSGGPSIVASSTNSLDTWYHLAVVRNGSVITMYRDGVSVGSRTSVTASFNWGKLGARVGGGNWDGAQSYFNGYIDDLRITKGYARYTANFTPPTEALPNKGTN